MALWKTQAAQVITVAALAFVESWGLFGGEPGACGSFSIRDDDGRKTELPGKTPSTPLKQSQCVIIETPGAGGYGPPSERAKQSIMDDINSGKFTAGYVRAHYGESSLSHETSDEKQRK
jgi:N-methylhydantoinase B